MALQIKGKVFLIIGMLVAAVPLLSCSGKVRPPAQSSEMINASAEKLAADILNYVNEYRQTKGLSPLVMNDVISAVAKQHSNDMAGKKTPFGHEGFEDRIKFISQKLGVFHRSAENVAYGDLDARQVVDVWLKSPGHRRNIEGKYTVTGIGTSMANDGTIFFTQIFAAK